MIKTFVFFFSLSLSSLFAAPLFIGIAGGTGSGKTTLADKIREAFPKDSVLISQDSYYKDISHLSIEERAKTNFDHPSALDFDLLKEHLVALREGRSIQCPIYNFQTHSRERGAHLIEAAPIIIVEGILLLAIAEIRELFDLKLFIDTDDDIRLLRRIERDIKERARDLESVKKQYIATVKPMHDAFVMPSKHHADVIVPRGYNEIALSLILAKLHADLRSLRESLTASNVPKLEAEEV